MCQFCGKSGDGHQRGAGRLIYYRQNDWVHVNCTLWASEVFEEVDGSLQNVSQALSRSSKLFCTRCNGRGAVTGCCQQHCLANYHFECGLQDGAAYKEDKTVYCPKHAPNHAKKRDTDDFSVRRTVYIDLEGEGTRKKQRTVDLRTAKFCVGSLVVTSLGELGTGSDYGPDAVVPLGYECNRNYWSTLDPTRMVR